MTKTTVPASTADLRDIALSLIDVPQGRRALDPNWVETLAADFKVRGQRTPIEVLENGDRFRLVFGGHRVAARALNGDAFIAAIVKQPKDFANEAEIKLAEIVENFMRRELSVLDRAFDVAAWREVFETVKGTIKPGRKAKTGNSLKSETISDDEIDHLASQFADGFSEAAQKALQLSRPAVFRYLKIAAIGETNRQRISLLPIADNQSELLSLVAQPSARQARIIDRLVDGATSVADAIAIIDDVAPEVPLAPWERMSERFARLQPSDQHQFFSLHEDVILQWVASRKR